MASFRWLALACLITSGAAYQLLPSQLLSGQDLRDFSQEINRLKAILHGPCDRCFVEFEMARTYAAGHQYPQAIAWLRRVERLRCGLDPRRDRLFGPLHGTNELGAMLRDSIRDPQVLNSREVASLIAADVTPENLAYDLRRNIFYLGNTRRSEVLRCSRDSQCKTFARLDAGPATSTLGLKLAADGGSIWVASNSRQGASLYQLDLASSSVRRQCHINGRHAFNDLAISQRGEVFVTDTLEGSIYRLDPSDKTCIRVLQEHKFTAANGITLSPDERTLYVSCFPDGIAKVDLISRSVGILKHRAQISLAYVDGLYAFESRLLAIQNGPMTPRIVELFLSKDGRSIRRLRILERGNPVFNGLTTGTLVDGRFYYVANSQLDKTKSQPLSPFKVLAISVAVEK